MIGVRCPKGESAASKVVGDRPVGTVQGEVHEHSEAGIWRCFRSGVKQRGKWA